MLIAVNSRLIIENLMKVCVFRLHFLVISSLPQPFCFSSFIHVLIYFWAGGDDILDMFFFTVYSVKWRIFLLFLQYGWLISTGFWFRSTSLRDWPLLMCW